MSYLDLPLAGASLEARAQDSVHATALFASGVGQIADSPIKQAHLFLAKKTAERPGDFGLLELKGRMWGGRLFFDDPAFDLLLRAFFAPAPMKVSLQFLAEAEGGSLRVTQLSFGVTRG